MQASLRFTWVLLAAMAGGATVAHANVAASQELAAQEPHPALVVEVAWALGVSEVETLLASCEKGYANGSCREGSASPNQTLWGRVESQSSDHVVIELHVSDRAAERMVSRELAFRAEDSATERAKAVGLTLGVIAAGLGESLSKTPPAHPAPKPRAAEPAPRPETTATLQVLAGLARDPQLSNFEGTGAVRGQLRSGGQELVLRAGVDGSRSGSRQGALTLTRVAPTVGTGWQLGDERLALTLALDAGAEWLNASTSAVGSPVEAARWSPLLRASATTFLPLLPHAGVALSTQLNWTSSPTTSFLRGEPVERTSGFQFALLAGLYVGAP